MLNMDLRYSLQDYSEVLKPQIGMKLLLGLKICFYCGHYLLEFDECANIRIFYLSMNVTSTV